MSEWNAEKFAQRIFDVGLLDSIQIEAVWSELGSRDVSLDDLTSFMLGRQLITNLQVDRILKGERIFFFYGKYKVLYLIGTGSFARVYRAVNTKTGDVVAVKVLRNRWLGDLERRDHFLREANLVMPIRHPNIVPVFEVNTERDRPYMVMEFVEGTDLRDFLKQRKKFNVEESLKLIADVTAGLEHAASKSLTHRDLKLSNVLVTSSARAMLVDFGLAAIAEAAKDDKSSTKGSQRSVDYVGLERISGVRKEDSRSDVYFAGCMLYHLLTGKAPLVESREVSIRLSATRFREVKPITEHEPGLPGAVVAVVKKAMDLDADKRYQSAGDFYSDIKATQHSLSEQGKAELAASANQGPIEREGEGFSVMIVESNIEMQDTLRDLLKRRGYRVLVIGDCQRALARWETSIEPPAGCVIFCSTEFGQEAIESFNKFSQLEEGKDIPTILCVDEKHKDLAKLADTNERRIMLAMPLKVRQLRMVLRSLLTPAPSPTAPDRAADS
jgi:serine/threonine-protein kinase